jgi:hypothetical protein
MEVRRGGLLQLFGAGPGLLVPDGLRAERFLSGSGPFCLGLGHDRLDELFDPGPIVLWGEILPAGQGSESDGLLLRVVLGREVLASAPEDVLPAAVIPGALVSGVN